jgi:hypothetical protein
MYCLFILGTETSQSLVRHASDAPLLRVLRLDDEGGVNEDELIKAARRFGAKPETIAFSNKADGKRYADAVYSHAKTKGPLLISCGGSEYEGSHIHWIAVLGVLNDKLVVDDPFTKGGFELISREVFVKKYGYNEPGEGEDEPGGYYAIGLTRTDGQAPVWKLTKEFLVLCDKGSCDTAQGLRDSLDDIAAKAGRAQGKLTPLADILRDLRVSILSSLEEIELDREDTGNLIELFDDYLTIADAARTSCIGEVKRELVVGRIVALLITAKWNRWEL